MYFHVVYGGGRRRYGDAGRNSHKLEVRVKVIGSRMGSCFSLICCK